MSGRDLFWSCVAVAVFGTGPVFLPEEAPAATFSYGSTNSEASDPDPRQFGHCSRRTFLTVSEIHYHPAQREDGLNVEFLELFNSDPVNQDISGYRVSGEVDYTFPDGTVVPAREYVVIAADPSAISTVYPVSTVFGPYLGALSNGGGRVRVRNAHGAVVLDVEYDDAMPWPVAADGAGHSLVLRNPDYGEGDVRAWAQSGLVGGSPGTALPGQCGELEQLQVNEFLAHTDDPQLDFIELHNYGTAAVNVAGCILTDDPTTNKYVLTHGVVAANGLLVFDQNELGFSLSMGGDDIFLIRPDGRRVLDAVRFGAQSNGVSMARYPDGAGAFHALTAPTPGAPNVGVEMLVEDMVINELMYHPISGDDDDEYIELHNKGATTADLSNWRFTDGIEYVFPAGTTIPPGGYLVVARNVANLLSRYSQLNAGNAVGDYSGRLSDSGERVVLSRPDDPRYPRQDFVAVDEVTYGDGSEWGAWSDGDGSSLELIDARADNRLAANWAGSDETQKAPWTEVDLSDVVSSGDTAEFKIFFILANQRSEFLIDDVFFGLESDQVNLVRNPGFDSNADRWSFRGNHWLSSRESTGGYGDDGGVLRVRALGQGNVRSMATARQRQFDRVETTLSKDPTVNALYRTRARVRWQAGWPYLRLSLGWYWYEALVKLQVPQNLGSPGLANSASTPNAPPAIWDVAHSPLLPTANETVRVTCRAADPDGIDSVSLEYRNTANSTYTSTGMHDDGLPPDRLAGDGIFTGQFPGYASGKIAGFRVVATDGAASPRTRHAPGQDSSRDALVRFGDGQPSGMFIDYAVWVSPENEALWESWETRANGEVCTTVVYNGWRAIYDATIRWRGNGRSFSDIKNASYSVTLPKTEPIIGGDEVKMDIPSRDTSNGTFLQEYHSYWIARQIGYPAAQVRLMRVHVNGSNLLRQDLEVPTREFCSYWYGDSDPHIFEHRAEHVLQHFTKTPTGDTNMAKYRHGLQKKRTTRPDALYRRFPLVAQALLEPDLDVRDARLKALVHPFGFCAYAAVNRVVGNADAYGISNAHNGSAYVSPQRRLRWHLVDMDPSYRSTLDLYPIQEIGEVVNRPLFMRAYRRILKALAEGPLQPQKANTSLDDWYQVLVSEGHSPTAPTSMKDYDAQQIVKIESDLAGHIVPFEITTEGGADFATTNRLVTLSGSAPFEVAAFTLNGRDLPVTYPSDSTWQATFGLAAGTNHLTVQGWGDDGMAMTSGTITVTSTASPGTPADDILITEIMYHPPKCGAEFIEIHNRSTTEPYDLQGCRMAGVDHTFGPGSILPPGGYRIITDDLQLYTESHTNAEVVIGEYAGSLDNSGETLRLLLPAGSNTWVDLDRVGYDDSAPWPEAADGWGPSLQRIDASQDSRSQANWTINVAVPHTPGAPNSVATNLPALPSLWINEIMPHNVAFVADGSGDFDPWLELYNAETGGVDLGDGYFLSDTHTNLLKWPIPEGWSIPGQDHLLVWADGETNETTQTELHAGFALNAQTGSVLLVWTGAGAPLVLDWLDYAQVPEDNSTGRYPDGTRGDPQIFHYPTPDSANSASSIVARIFINEWLALNDRTLEDPAAPGEFDDWVELYNAGPASVNLTGFHLTDDLSAPQKFTIPLGASIDPGGFLVVWADEDPQQNAAGRVHASFGLKGTGEEIGLHAPDGRLVDAITFGPQIADISEGRWLDGWSDIYQMAIPTPGAANVVFMVDTLAASTGGAVELEWNARADWWYQVWQATNVQNGNAEWQPWGAPLLSGGDRLSTNVPGPAADGVLFYRIEQVTP